MLVTITHKSITLNTNEHNKHRNQTHAATNQDTHGKYTDLNY